MVMMKLRLVREASSKKKNGSLLGPGLGGGLLGKSGKMKVWRNSKGQWCVGNNCMRLRVADGATHVAFNPNAKSCPADFRKVMDGLLKNAKEGKNSIYHQPSQEEW